MDKCLKAELEANRAKNSAKRREKLSENLVTADETAS